MRAPSGVDAPGESSRSCRKSYRQIAEKVVHADPRLPRLAERRERGDLIALPLCTILGLAILPGPGPAYDSFVDLEE